MKVVLIAAVARNGVIGKEGGLPWRLPDDLARFKRLTLGKTVVMGRRTFASLGKPLPGRRNLVLSRTSGPLDGTVVVRSPEEAMAVAGDELWVLGGRDVYAAFLPRADVLELTEVDAEVGGDVLFPPFERDAFAIAAQEAHPADARHALPFRFVTYVRRPRP